MDDMETPDEQPPTGTWFFTGFEAMIEGTEITVTVGDGTMFAADNERGLCGGDPDRGEGYLAVEGTAYKLTLAEGR